MDSSEEISDNILSYLENFRDSDTSMIEGENVSTATDNDINNGSEFDNSLNPLTSPPSLKSAFSSKKLEWDSSADVGCIPLKTAQFNARLSTLERMALSNSASKLCIDEDEQSLALIAKIDRVLAKSRSIAKVHNKSSKKLQKLSTWPSVDSGSNGSTSTVIPVMPDMKKGSRHHVPDESHPEKATKQSVKFPTSHSNEEYQSQNQKRSHASRLSKPQLQRSKSTPQYDACASELFITHSVASEEMDLYASNEIRPDSSFLATPPNLANSDTDQASNQCRCVSADFSESTTCPTHASLSSEHTRRMRREALGELQVYRNLKDHLKNLKDYVSQLEQTWKFLDQKQSTVHSRSREGQPPPRHSRSKSHKVTVPSFHQSPPLSSRRSSDSQTSESQATVMNSIGSLKSDRSFELERLNLHDTDSNTEETRPTRKSKSKCCNHCSLKTKSVSAGHKKTIYEKGVQTSEPQSRSSSSVRSDVVVPQREPIAYDISLENRSKPQERPRSKTTLQEALKNRRPDFLHDSELRRKTIQEISEMRRMGMLDSNYAPHLFTYQELRKRTEELYRQLPEFRNRNRDHQSKETIVSNRIKASVFQKKLQSRVLQGQLNLPHSTCL